MREPADSRAMKLLPALLAVLALVSCGGSDDPKANETEAGFTVYEVSSGGFEIAVPNSWRVASSDDVFDDETIQEISQQVPELSRFFESLESPDSLMKLVALDPDVEADFATNVNVIIEPVPDGFTKEQYFGATVANVKRFLPLATDVEREPASLPAGDGMRVRYEQEPDGGQRVSTLQYVLFVDGTGYILTYTMQPDRDDEYERDFARSAESFRLLDGS
jgi:hypothetical protein